MSLPINPENETIRSIVRDTAKVVVKDFHRIQDTLNSLSSGIDTRLELRIKDLNLILKNISDLNQEIAAIEVTGSEVADLRDQRDLAIKNLSRYFKVNSYQDNRGAFVVSAEGVGTLVDGTHYLELASSAVGKEKSSDNRDGSAEIFFKGHPNRLIGNKLRDGEISSMVKVRNSDIKGLREAIDKIAFDFANAVNAIHRRGFVSRQVDVKGGGKVTGIDFFKVGDKVEGAALSLDLSGEVKTGFDQYSDRTCTQQSGGQSGCHRYFQITARKCLWKTPLPLLEEHFLKTVGNVAIEAGKARLDSEQSKGVLLQMENLRERLSGVSVDEETENLLRFQRTYQASAKAIQAADHMLETVLNITD